MRTIPKIKLNDKSNEIAAARIKKISRIAAIAFILIVQLAIIYKMLL
jgi:hypothetical protein